MMNAKALEQTVAGDLASASKTIASEIRVTNAIDIMVNGADLGPLASDWKARCAAILVDLATADKTTSPEVYGYCSITLMNR